MGGSDDGERRFLEARLLVSAFLAMGVMTFSLVLYGDSLYDAADDAGRTLVRTIGGGLLIVFSLPVLLLLGIPLLRGAWIDLRQGMIRMDGLIALATMAAYGLSVHNVMTNSSEVYFETATMVLVLVTFGRRLEAHTRTRARDAAESLAKARPDVVHRVIGTTTDDVRLDRVARGDVIRVLPGESVPCDLEIRDGSSEITSAHVTGEEAPRPVGPGSIVEAGSANGSGLVTGVVRESPSTDSLARLREMLVAPVPETRRLRRIDALAGRLALVAIVVAGVAGIRMWTTHGVDVGLKTSLAVLLVACPCALGLATPLAYRAIRAALARRGLIVHEPVALEVAPNVDIAFLDKTGTLTNPDRSVLTPLMGTETALERLERLVAWSGHSLGRGFLRGAAAPVALTTTSGSGFEADLEGSHVHVGRPDWVAEAAGCANQVDPTHRAATAVEAGSLVAMAEDGELTALASISHSLREHAVEAVEALRSSGRAVHVLSGDHASSVARTADELAVDATPSLRPEDKVRHIEDARRDGKRVLFVGDGINDAPALRTADVGVAVGSGQDVARDQAQVEFVGDDLRAVPDLIEAAVALRHTVRGNLFWTLLYNAVAMGAAATGRLHPLVAVSAMTLSSIWVAIRSHRLLGWTPERERAGRSTET